MLHKIIVLWGETVLIAAEYSVIQTRNTTDDTKCPQIPFLEVKRYSTMAQWRP